MAPGFDVYRGVGDGVNIIGPDVEQFGLIHTTLVTLDVVWGFVTNP